MKLNFRKVILLSLFALLLLGVVIVSGCTSTADSNANVQKVQPNGETKTVQLDFKSGMVYNPDEIRVKAGTRLRIEGDPETLVGGMDTIIVDGYDVEKKILPGDNVLEFVADIPGEFRIHCANQMGDGKLIVET